MAQIDNVKTSGGLRRMLGRDLQWWLDWANTAYIAALIVAAFAASAIVVASWLIVRWQGEIQAGKEAAFERYATEARQQIANAQLAAAEAGVEAANANERAAKLSAESSRLKLELDREIRKRAPRSLTETQKEILISELRGRLPKLNVVMQADAESQKYAYSLIFVLNEAGLDVSPVPMPLGHTMPLVQDGRLLMYSPRKARSEDELKDDPLYLALKKADLFGGIAAEPLLAPGDFFSLLKDAAANTPNKLPDNEYILYVFAKSPS